MADAVIRFAILGYGRAGQARARVIRRDPHTELVSVYGGRRAAEAGACVASSAHEAIEAAHVVCVCSPPVTHPDYVRAALERGRHVICEYPLAASEAQAEALYGLAARANRTLHVAHTDLLGAAAATIRGNVPGFAIRRVALTSQGPGEEGDLDGLVGAAAGEILRITDLIGPIEQIDDARAGPGRLQAWMSAAGVAVELTVEVGPYYGPWRFLQVHGLQGTWTLENQALTKDRVPQTLLEATSPTEKDHVAALRRMLDGDAPYLRAEAVMHALRVAERIAAQRSGPIAVTSRSAAP